MFFFASLRAPGATNDAGSARDFNELAQRIEHECHQCVRRDENGAVVYLVASGATDDELALISREPSIRELMVGGVNNTDRGMAALGQMTNLVSLGLVRSNAMQAACRLPRLRKLSFSCSPMKPADLSGLIKMTNLEDLSLRGAWRIGAGTISAMTNFTHLKRLIIGGGGERPEESIAEMCQDGHANAAGWAGWRKLEISELMVLTNLTSLEELQVLMFPDFGDEQLQKFAALPNLKSLVLDETRVSDNWSNIVGRFPALTNAEVTMIRDQEVVRQKWVRKR